MRELCLEKRGRCSALWGGLWMVYTYDILTASEIDVCRVSAEGLRSVFTFT